MLITTPNIAAPDEFYEALINGHRGLTEAESHRMNARLVLLLANHVGDMEVLMAAIAAARSLPDPLPLEVYRPGTPVTGVRGDG